jgi:hypothetical protein
MAEDRVQRRLAAILAADVAGYSRLMGINETGRWRSLKAHRNIQSGEVLPGSSPLHVGEPIVPDFPKSSRLITYVAKRFWVRREATLIQRIKR